MKGRYLALFGSDGAARAGIGSAAAQLGLAPRLEGGDVLLLAEPITSVMVAPTGDVAIVGELFSRSDGYAPVERLDHPAAVR